jgi:hypothetical protein
VGSLGDPEKVFYQNKVYALQEEPPKPELIQGYTAEQWQEIIDGGYLCEFTDGYWEDEYSDLGPLVSVPTVNGSGVENMFERIKGRRWLHCRPAQIKGAMRPIWVEPVDDSVTCHFFDKTGTHLGTAYPWEDYSKLKNHVLSCSDKYIEL